MYFDTTISYFDGCKCLNPYSKKRRTRQFKEIYISLQFTTLTNIQLSIYLFSLLETLMFDILLEIHRYDLENKRAQRALERSPESEDF